MISVQDKKVLDMVVFGRVKPCIYAFRTNTIPDYLKVGDTYRPVSIRLNEWKKIFSDLKKVNDWSATVGDDKFFRDYAVHKYLENDLGKVRLEKSNSDKYYSKEFFHLTSGDDVERAIEDIKKCYKAHENKYTFYDVFLRQPEVEDDEEDLLLKPRDNQQIVIDNFNNAINTGHTNLLMYAVMRFGKTFTALCCANAMEAKLVVVVSAKADVAAEWKSAVKHTTNFKDYCYVDKGSLTRNEHIVKELLSVGKKVVVFLTLQDLQGNLIKDRQKDVFASKIDLLIIDETHFAARAEKYGAVLHVTKKQTKQKDGADDSAIFSDEDMENAKQLNAKVRLHLSGTPYRILMGSEFAKEDIIAFCQFTDIADAQKEWDEKHLERKYKDEKTGEYKIYDEWDNPYYGFPQMVRFAFNPNKAAREKLKVLKSFGVNYDLSSLFETKSIECNDKDYDQFKFETEIVDLLKAIDGAKQEDGILPFLDYDKIKEGNMCRHIVFVLPYRASCDAMEKLLKKHKGDFTNLSEYEIVNIAGFTNSYRNIQTVKKKIEKCEQDGKKTITLTVNRMLTGSTVKEWDTMLYLKNSSSPQEYDQAIFRLQNPYIKTAIGDDGKEIKYNMKPQTLLVDFDPMRMFYLQELRSKIYDYNTDRAGNNKLEERIEKELTVSPVIFYNKEELKQVKAADVMSAVLNYTKDRSVREEVENLSPDLNLLTYDIVAKAISDQAEIGSKYGISIVSHEGETTDFAIPPEGDITDEVNATVDTKDLVSNKSEAKDDEDESMRKRFQTYYMRILFYAYLTKTQGIKSLEDIIASIDVSPDNRRIAKNIGLSKPVLCCMQTYMDLEKHSDLDYAIQRISTLASDKDLSPLERAINVTKKFDRYSESEIRTPDNIASDMVGMLPKDFVRQLVVKRGRVLDIAAKSGEFTIAMWELFTDNGFSVAEIKDLLYSIPTSSIAYEFTRKIYEILGLNIDNIAAKFTSHDIVPLECKNGSRLQRERCKQITSALQQNRSFSDITLKNITINTQAQEVDIMKFNLIIGNPPYQIGDGGGTGDSAKPIYHLFVQQAKELSPEYIVMITPSRWMKGGKGLTEFRKEMIADTRITDIHDYEDAKECFPSQYIDGGVSYFSWSLAYRGPVSYTYKPRVGQEVLSQRYLKNNFCDVVIRDNRQTPILEKTSVATHWFSDIVASRNHYGIDADAFNKPEKYTSLGLTTVSAPNLTKLYGVKGKKGGAKRVVGYLRATNTISNIENFSKYKLFFSKAYMATATVPPEIIVGFPNEICTDTFLSVGNFSTQQEALNCMSYIKTKFFRALLFFNRHSLNMSKESFALIPIESFNKSWTDEELYRKYSLSQADINFIETTIDPME